jgi:squalene synthase HpnC
MTKEPEPDSFGPDKPNAIQYGTVETPSGKDANYENFPVGSWLLARDLRSHVAVFYAFARAIDDIADNSSLGPEEKVRRLDGFKAALLGRDLNDLAYQTAHNMRTSLDETGITPAHCIDLISAFKLDATKLRYRNWDELIGYCILSAAPVGRYLIDLHGGSRDGYGPSDALCNALQIINHLQDCKDDYQTLDRVYLPGNWLAEEGVSVNDLAQEKSTDGLRKVLGRCLKETSVLLTEAKALPSGLKSRRLSMESAVIIEISQKLIRCLENGDPLSPKRIKLTKIGYLCCCIKGVARLWLPS